MEMIPQSIKSNIDNLTSLWRVTSGAHLNADARYDHCFVPFSQWPNRLWFRNKPTKDDLAQARKVLASMPDGMIVPSWEIYGESMRPEFETAGFEKLFSQIGMSMPVPETTPTVPDIVLRPVRNETDAKLWCDFFEESFGYRIGENILAHTWNDVSYYLVFQDSIPSGCLLLHFSGDTVGFHAMGITKTMRKKGIAEKAMWIGLETAKQKGSTLATLQASDMGKGVYERIGFKSEFVMDNFKTRE
ncbi:hypothetical protein FUAX_30690 [Fulvitalea axinellae]|uniref:N-acetyltransferase domain-containing protein n=1 Tax=Fulvitalea axinellae TaxID=1182444 RepID=A0AAU9CU98_9BACT|nr:hypothetical protein FUAX_30690 [Fulvitalea axinellae]